MKNQLTKILNVMLTIQTKGQDTLSMADCIRGLATVIDNIPEATIEPTEQTEES